MHRRSFLKRAALAASSIAGLVAGISIFRIFSRGSGREMRRVKIGAPSEFPVDSYTLLEDHGIYIYRDHEGIKAVSAICTHLGCTVQKTDEGFECPCHGSCYSEQGKVLSGPAPGPLNWYAIEKTADGRLQVDLDRVEGADYKYLFV
jgi:cytochrome b6-f complex iron-sulfur subunit